MLILTRSNQETLRIGDNITITIIDIKGKQIRFGIDAPKEVAVVREELLKRNNDIPQRHSAQNREEVIVHSENNMQYDKPYTTKPKVVYKRRKAVLDHP